MYSDLLKKNKIKYAHFRLSTVALFSVLHKAIATLLASDQVLHVGHVEKAHSPSLLEVAVQVPFAAAAENSRERMPGSRQTLYKAIFVKESKAYINYELCV